MTTDAMETIYDGIKDGSPVPVCELSLPEYIGGSYNTETHLITINSNDTTCQKLVALIHEEQHAKCQRINCKCKMSSMELDDRIQQEFHAQHAVWKYAIFANDEQLTTEVIRQFHVWQNAIEYDRPIYYHASNLLMTTPEYEQLKSMEVLS